MSHVRLSSVFSTCGPSQQVYGVIKQNLERSISSCTTPLLEIITYAKKCCMDSPLDNKKSEQFKHSLLNKNNSLSSSFRVNEHIIITSDVLDNKRK